MNTHDTAPKSVILYGPQGSGKTRHAPKLARHFGLAHWREEWFAGDPLPLTNHLVLTSEPVPAFLSRCICIDTALKLLASGQPLTDDVFAQDAPNIPRRRRVDDDAPERRPHHRVVEIDLGAGPELAGAQVMRTMLEPLISMSRLMPTAQARAQLWRGMLGSAAGAMTADIGFEATNEVLQQVTEGLARVRGQIDAATAPGGNVH